MARAPSFVIIRLVSPQMIEQPMSTPRVETALPPTDDPLAEPLRLLELTGVLHCRAELSAPWGIDLPRIDDTIAIHVVTEGRCWLDVAGQAPRDIPAGSVAVLPHGSAHRIRSAPEVVATPLSDIPVHYVTDRYERMRHGGGGATTRISYCGVRFDPRGAHRLLRALPLVVHVDSQGNDDSWVRDTVAFIAREADAGRPGSEAVITRLADIIVVQAIRAWLDATEHETGWLSALRDRYVSGALAAIHRSPERDWSVRQLADTVGLSRSAFSARFSRCVGQSVMQYVTEWRMHLARKALLETNVSLAQVAEDSGYGSEAAFSRAFKKTFGVSPGSVRRTSDRRARLP